MEENEILTTTTEDGSTTINIYLPPDAAPESEVLPVEGDLETDTVLLDSGAAANSFSLDAPAEHQSGSLPAIIQSVLGDYHPRTQTVEILAEDGTVSASYTEIVPGIAGLDFYWLGGALLFGVCLVGLIQIVRSVICRV